ncbi:MAG: tetratricopeptide repeat protein [Candidatus Marinimicrobia bacterium]|nr:tetratricopeptide repeat protein [Candidatus Neomarinimicrobiota bacterium]MCF7827690.1 tetratricopeptide repeat protein [Candidatus Neomarinimicrobiota bacterium]MCF7881255.1 tetratricopeptide repeat protein [Candidatus Neomarinimicrobiota bacterium]
MEALIRKYSGIAIAGMIAVVALISIGCQPPQMTPEERKAYEDSVAQARQDSILQANKAKCEFMLSNGYEYYKQRNWEKAIENYEQVRELGCGPGMAENLYLYLGNAYREVGTQDSAIAVYAEGLEHLPDNLYLHQNLAYMYKITNQTQKQIEIQEELVALDSTNVEYLMDLADLYFSTNQFDKQIEILQKVLEIDPQNSVAQSSLITAMEKAGKDPIDALKTRWENNKENSTYGVEYGEKLFERGEYQKAVNVFREVTSIDSENIRAWNRLAAAYDNLEQPAKAIEAYRGILNIDPQRKDIVADIAELYIQMKEFQQAMDWASRAINTGSENGLGYATRGKVYENLAAECSGGSPDFNDKLVYQMAYEDYQQAVSMGYGQINARIEYLTNFIPSKGDWFFHEDEGPEIAPSKDCYSWLDRSVSRPSN